MAPKHQKANRVPLGIGPICIAAVAVLLIGSGVACLVGDHLSADDDAPSTTTSAAAVTTTATATTTVAGTTTDTATTGTTTGTTTATTTVTTAATTTAAPTATTTKVTTTKSPTATTTKPTTAATSPDTTGRYVQQNVPSWNLRLVNGWNRLSADYPYEANLTSRFGSQKKFDARAADALDDMLKAGSAYGLRADSLFRSYDLQVTLYNRKVNTYLGYGYSQSAAEDKAATIVARPGTSEHHLGLAADILCKNVYSLEESFENTEAFAWLKANCAQYGFILRYPKDKEDVTGVIYEPWHYRYVGVEAATEIMSRGITLEEYLAEKYG